MPRAYKRLTDRKIATTKKAARLADGEGLYLVVNNESSKHWVFEYQLKGKRRYVGLGSLRDVTLAEAREQTAQYRKLKAKGLDPLTHKKSARAAQALEDAKAVTFKEAANRYMDANRVGWERRYGREWQASLEKHVYPTFGDLPVQSVDKALVLTVIEPLWTSANVSAVRLRGRLEAVLDWAKAMDMRAGENPARWRGHLDKILPAPKKVHRVKSYASMPWERVPAFTAELRAHDDEIACAALEYVILTAVRKVEAVEAQWSEIDLGEAVWTVPAVRMKKRVEHRIPLSRAAIDVLDRMKKKQINEFVFPATIRGTKRISHAVLGRLMESMGRGDYVPHGFRSSFRTWAGDETSFAREIIEKALAHVVGDKTERAYDRGDLFDKRRKLMDAWGAFATSYPVKAGDNVIEPQAWGHKHHVGT
jgi:integrase